MLIVPLRIYSLTHSLAGVRRSPEKCFWGPGKSWKSPGNFCNQESGNPVVFTVMCCKQQQNAILCACFIISMSIYVCVCSAIKPVLVAYIRIEHVSVKRIGSN